ncbi:MAG: hypothetical protein MI922_00880 [Bacteroidales bacterium]|nr:hypothetical protein [Bacteroidales bacterium]
MLRLDVTKQKKRNTHIPICIHPSTLIQLLQFWVPRNDEFEETMLGTLRLPFLFKKFDSDAEKTSIRILQALSRFEGIDDLPEEAISSVVLNEGLRERVKQVEDEDEQVTLIRDTLLDEVRNLEEMKNAEIKGIKSEVAKKDIAI